MDLAEMHHRSLAETLAATPNDELYLWIARAQRKAKQQDGRRMPLGGR